jgi:hypothetical protein
MKLLKKLALTASCVALLGIAVNASALTIGDTNYIGKIDFGIPAGDADRQNYVNYLIDMTPGASAVPGGYGQNYYRSSNVFTPMPDAVWASNKADGGSYNVGGGGYYYMLAKYDGPNYGSEVWYIKGLTGTISIPTTAGGYGLSGVTFFNKITTTEPPGVPDGGATALLLGAALSGIALLRRKA